MIECKSALKPVLGDVPIGKNRSGVVDENINARLFLYNLGSHPLHLGETGKVGIMDAMSNTAARGLEPRQCHARARPVAGDENDASAHPREAFSSNLADPGGGASHNDRLAPHCAFLKPRLCLQLAALPRSRNLPPHQRFGKCKVYWRDFRRSYRPCRNIPY